jgi:hypothetical protein
VALAAVMPSRARRTAVLNLLEQTGAVHVDEAA